MNRKITLLAAVLTLAVPLGVSAQQTTEVTRDNQVAIRVTIVDDTGVPLPGASVRIQGTKLGAIADAKGQVSLHAPRGSKVIFSFIGMKSLELILDAPLSGPVKLDSQASALDQVVVTGYAKTSTRRSAGSVATIKGKDLLTQPLVGVDALLQGKLAGVDVRSVSGRPGQTAEIRIRGINTLTGNASPLWVVDGIPLQRDLPAFNSSKFFSKDFSDLLSDGIAGLNPNDIESVTVLKDAAAAAIYGSRAASGVIVITTKRGAAGKMRINYSTNLSATARPSRTLDLMNSKEKLAWEQELWDEFSEPRRAKGLSYPVLGAVGAIRSGYGRYTGWTKEQQDAEIARLGEHTTDWFAELFRPSFSHSHYLSLSGGSEKSRYFVSLGYLDNKGLLRVDGYSRYTLSSKLDITASERVKLGLSLDMAMQRTKGPSSYIDPYTYAFFANPYERPDANDETYRSLRIANNVPDPSYPINGFNIKRELEETSNKITNFSGTANANLTVRLLDDLNFTGTVSFGYVGNDAENYNAKTSYAAWLDRRFEDENTPRTYASLAQSQAYNLNYTLRGQLNWSPTFATDHHLSVLAGSEIRGHYAKTQYAKFYGYDPETGNYATPIYPEGTKVDYTKLQTYGVARDGLSGRSIGENAFASFYFSSSYNYKTKYVASLTGRIDGSSNFGSKEQFNPTGSLGLAWNVDREGFFDRVFRPLFSSLTLRTAVGYTGNINRSVYPQLILNYLNSYRQGDGESYRMARVNDTPNPHLRWEKTRDAKVSVEMGMLSERLRLSVEAYDRYTSDAVSPALVTRTTGFATQSYNTSTLSNRGIEVTLYGAPIQTKDWRLSATANLSYNRNKLLTYNAPTSGLVAGYYPGYPLGALFSGKPDGIDPVLGIYRYQLRPDADALDPSVRTQTSNYLFYRGLLRAPYSGGYSVSLGWRDLTLSLGGSFQIGGKATDDLDYPASIQTLAKPSSIIERLPSIESDLYYHHLNGRRDVRDRWTPANPRTDAHPRLIDPYGEFLGLSNYGPRDASVTRVSRMQDLSYLRLGSVALSYAVPSDWVKRNLHVGSLSCSFSMSNLLLLTKYKGIDPETPGAVYPLPRSYSFGLSVGL